MPDAPCRQCPEVADNVAHFRALTQWRRAKARGLVPVWMNLNFEESQARQAVTGARVIERASSGEELEMSALHLPCLS